jgi:hypothetical protein
MSGVSILDHRSYVINRVGNSELLGFDEILVFQ